MIGSVYMIAEIKSEKNGRRSTDLSYVCVVGGVPRFRFSMGNGWVEDMQNASVITCDQHTWLSCKRIYEVPGVEKFEIGHRTLDGVRPNEDWPTPSHQYLVLGSHRYSVDPISGCLSFEWSDNPALDFPNMIFAFNLYSGFGEADWD